MRCNPSDSINQTLSLSLSPQITIFLLVLIVVVILKAVNLWAHYKVVRRRDKSQFWAIKRVVLKSLRNGWVWLDIIILQGISAMVVYYILYVSTHNELFEDFSFDFQSGFTNIPDQSVLISEIYNACFGSVTQSPVGGRNSRTLVWPPFFLSPPLLP